MPRPEREALSRALSFLQYHLRELGEGATLKGATALARQAGVGHGSMLKALEFLAREGVLRGGAGQRFRVPKGGPDRFTEALLAALTASATKTWERVAGRMEADVLAGDLGREGELPPMKELRRRYGVCHQTLRKSVDRLVLNGVAVREGRRLRVVHAGPTPGSSTLVLIARGLTVRDEPMLLSERTEQLLRLMENECRAHGLRLALRSVYYEEQDMLWSRSLSRTLAEGARSRNVLGTMFWTMGILPQTSFRLASEHLAVQRCPVAVLDDEGHLPPSLVSNTLACFRSSSNDDGGEAVGRYVAAKGHRRVAFVTAHANASWSQGRQRGLARVMTNAGGTCLECAAGPPTSEDRSLRDQVVDRTTQTLFGGRWTTEDLMKQRAIMAPHFRFSGYVGRVALRRQLLPALDRLFARARPTALVCATDIEGLVCLDYLEDRGVRVPRDVAVVGFDDSIEASMWRLTSYSFGEPALVRAMMMHLLGMGWVRSHRSRTGRTVVPGHVVERETS